MSFRKDANNQKEEEEVWIYSLSVDIIQIITRRIGSRSNRPQVKIIEELKLSNN
jgi:hypothetical protein